MNASEIDWEALRKANIENGRTIKELSAKAGVLRDGSNWSPGRLKEGLETWEYYFMLASGFDAVANNGGLVHGLHCYFDDEKGTELYVPVEDMLACWKATGCGFLIEAHEIGQRELKRLGVTRYDALSLKQERKLEKALERAEERFEEPPGTQPFDIQLADYARKNRFGKNSEDSSPDGAIEK